MGLGEIGHLLSCNRDGAFCEGYDPKLKLERTQTHHAGREPLRLQVQLSEMTRCA
jgi:L-2-amino-thiazoline-4-carboxylic acid hydrolase